MYISMENITKSINNIEILNGVNFSVKKNQIHGLVGINGSGKSTLMNILMGLTIPDSGDVIINDEIVEGDYSSAREKITMVHQNIETLVDDLSVAENLYLGKLPKKRFGKIDWNKLYDDAENHLKKLDFDIDVHTTVDKINYSQKRMLEVARALTMDAEILILDEVYIGLEQYDQIKFMDLLKKINESGVTIIYISHKLKNVLSICDAVSVMSNNEIVETVYKNDFIKSRIIENMLEKESIKSYPRIHSAKNKPILKLDNISTKRLKNINFTLFEGEVLGVTGLIKSGCTALAETIFGLRTLDAGCIKVYNHKVDIKSPSDAIAYSIAYITNEQNIDDMVCDFNISDNMFLPNIVNTFSKKGDNQKKIAKKYIRDFRIGEYNSHDFLKKEDGQNLKKVSFARWHHLNSNIHIYHEPTRPLDIPSKIDFYNYVNYLTEKQKGIIFISSDIDELIGVCDRILVMYNGTLIKCFHKSDFNKSAILEYALGFDG